jgi:hypothetical protein
LAWIAAFAKDSTSTTWWTYNSRAYRYGGYVGEGINFSLTFVNPCQIGAVYAWGYRTVKYTQAAGNLYNASDAVQAGDYLGAIDAFSAAVGDAGLGGRSCFPAGTPVLTAEGARRIEELQAGDKLLAKPENDPHGAVAEREVEAVFVRVSPLLNLHVGEQVIRVTPEHPFWVWGKGWLAAAFLEPGDLLSSHDGRWLAVECVTDAGEVATVYNLRVAEYHTYFVGCPEWGFSVWAHNDQYSRELGKSPEAAGKPEPAGKAEPAHIVPVLRDGGKYSQRPKEVQDAIRQAKKALDDAGIGINSAANGFWARGGRSDMGTHRNKYFLEIGPRLEKAAKQGQVAAELGKIAGQAVEGVFRAAAYKG